MVAKTLFGRRPNISNMDVSVNTPRDFRRRADPNEQRALWISIIGIIIFLIWNLPRSLGAISNCPGLAQIEGAVIHMGVLLCEGRNPYPDPLLDKNISFLYGPLAPEILGLAFLVGGKTLVLPRIISTIAVFATGVVLGKFISKRRGWILGLWTALAWTAVQSTFSGFFYLARIDSISNLFIILAICRGVDLIEGRRAPLGAISAFCCALLCRQTAFIPLVILAFGVWWTRGAAAAVRFFLGPLFVFLIALFALHYASDGWSSKYLFSAGNHAWAIPEFIAAASRMFISPEMLLLWILTFFGWGGASGWWNATTAVMILLMIAHSSRWAALDESLAPAIAMMLPIASCAAIYQKSRSPAVGWLLQILFIIFPAALFFIRAPEWGVANPRAAVAERAPRANITLNLVREHPGRVLVNGFQDYAILADQWEIDDIHSALGPDTAGDPALEMIERNIINKRYSIILIEPNDLGQLAKSIFNIRPATAKRLDRVAGAVEKYYHLVGGERGVTDARLPNR